MAKKKSLTKAKIIEMISENTDIAKKDIGLIIDTFFKKIKEGLEKDYHIELRRFGTFGTKLRQSRTARNPKTNETINVPEHKIPYFKPGKELKETILNRKSE